MGNHLNKQQESGFDDEVSVTLSVTPLRRRSQTSSYAGAFPRQTQRIHRIGESAADSVCGSNGSPIVGELSLDELDRMVGPMRPRGSSGSSSDARKPVPSGGMVVPVRRRPTPPPSTIARVTKQALTSMNLLPHQVVALVGEFCAMPHPSAKAFRILGLNDLVDWHPQAQGSRSVSYSTNKAMRLLGMPLPGYAPVRGAARCACGRAGLLSVTVSMRPVRSASMQNVSEDEVYEEEKSQATPALAKSAQSQVRRASDAVLAAPRKQQRVVLCRECQRIGSHLLGRPRSDSHSSDHSTTVSGLDSFSDQLDE